MGTSETMNVKFIRAFRNDKRTNPDCAFLLTSVGATSTFASKVETQYWPNLYFTQVVPPLDMTNLGLVSDFWKAYGLYQTFAFAADGLVVEGYVIGRLVAQVLRGIVGEVTRRAFLDGLYNTRLFAFGGLLAGLYGRNYSGCETAVCNSNIGLRAVFLATLQPATGAMHYNSTLGYHTFPITELSFPVTKIVRPLLLGQLLPTDDPVWLRVAEAIGEQLQSAFAALNAAGGVAGRPVQLLRRYYAGDPTPAAAAFVDRYSLLALVRSVVKRSAALRPYAPAQIGTYQTDPPAEGAATDVQVQASLPLELMALAAFAYRLGAPVHLRAPATEAGRTALRAMVQSLHSLQQQPASSQTYGSAAEALQGASPGTVIAVGSDADVAAWFSALADLPQLRLLVPSPQAVHLLATLNVAAHPQASRLHYPYMFSTGSLQVVSGPDVNDAALYGQLLGNVLADVLASSGNVSLAYSTTPQLLGSWYGSQLKYNANGVTLGPYYSAACSATAADDCECNEGVRQVAVLTAARLPQPVAFNYSSDTCRVAYRDLAVAPTRGPWYAGVIAGCVGGATVLAICGWWLSRRGRRNNAAAPKDSGKPFCILFTDIQASTHLWATVPDLMATALHVHHTLIRRLIAKYKLYEVKTIGDSFMCASGSPGHAVDFALALQRALFKHDWGTEAIDTAYVLQQEAHHGKWTAARTGWNGLRVRVGVHYGQGEVYLDPVSKGYDYYGTVVNTAARVEAVCHGGQIGVTQAVFDALGGEFPGTFVTDLGEQVLRGLTGPVHLYQLLPAELSGRTFPPLRLEHAAAMEDAPQPFTAQSSSRTATYSKITVIPMRPGSRCQSPISQTLSPTTLAGRLAGIIAVPHWVETHPMVRSGQVAAEDLHATYCAVLRALATLLQTQTQRVRETAVRAFCEQLHVRNCGTEGPELEETLSGLVQRVLPAALGRRKPSNRSRDASLAPADSYEEPLHINDLSPKPNADVVYKGTVTPLAEP